MKNLENLSTPETIQRDADGQPKSYLHKGEISAHMIRDLYERGRISILFLLILISVIRWVIDAAYVADVTVRGAFFLLIAINVARWLFMMIPAQRRDALLGLRGQLVLFACGVFLSSAILGTLILLTWPLLDTAHITIFAVIIAGMVSGASMSLGFSPLVYMLYTLPPVSILFLMCVTDQRPDWGADILATAFALYALSVLVMSIDQSRKHRRAIELSLQLSDLAVRDTLTKLYNRRFLHEYMSVEAARVAREMTDVEQGRQPEYNAAIGVYMVDLDHFKRINDSHGHNAGDEMLKQAAEALISALRNSDVIVRWGGEEFVAVARVKQREHTAIVAEKLRRAVEEMETRLGNGSVLRASCSVGFCVIPFFPDKPRLLAWEQALEIADAALYRAKAEGRNRWFGVSCGSTAWPDVQGTYTEVLHDLKQADERGLVRIERSRSGQGASE
jgi:diguanylate cyclase (GGDEF)-like protein